MGPVMDVACTLLTGVRQGEPRTSGCRGDLAGAFSLVRVCWESQERAGGGRSGMCARVFEGIKLPEVSYRRVFRIFNCLFLLEVTNTAVCL